MINLIKALFVKLEGKKTYILSTLGALVVALHWLGVIDNEFTNNLLAVLGFGAVGALRAAKK